MSALFYTRRQRTFLPWPRLGVITGLGMMGVGVVFSAGMLALGALAYLSDLQYYGFHWDRLMSHCTTLLSGAALIYCFGRGWLAFLRDWNRRPDTGGRSDAPVSLCEINPGGKREGRA